MSLALLVPGAAGPLGAAVLELVRSERNTFARGLGRDDLDVTDPFAVKDMVLTWGRLLRSDSPEHRLVVVNAAALTDPAACEADEDAAYAVNAAAPALLASACAAVGAGLVHVSCADVFAGDRSTPYDVDDPPGPRSAYGRTKLAGEQAVHALLPDTGYVVRTGWLYSGSEDGGRDAVAELVQRVRAGGRVLAADRPISPTWTRDLAAGLLALAAGQAPAGTYHGVNDGATTELALARAVLEELGEDPERAQPRPAGDQPIAARPGGGALSPRSWDTAGLPPLRHWRAALTAALTGGATLP